jgi:hypothetical protein
MVPKRQTHTYFLKECIINYIMQDHYPSSAVYLRNAPENFFTRILNNFQSKTCLKDVSLRISSPWSLANYEQSNEEREFYSRNWDYLYILFFNLFFRCYVLFLVIDKWEMSSSFVKVVWQLLAIPEQTMSYRLPEFLDNQHMKLAVLSALRFYCLYSFPLEVESTPGP